MSCDQTLIWLPKASTCFVLRNDEPKSDSVSSQVEQQSANSMSKIGLALGVVGLVAGALGIMTYIIIQVLGAATIAAAEYAPFLRFFR